MTTERDVTAKCHNCKVGLERIIYCMPATREQATRMMQGKYVDKQPPLCEPCWRKRTRQSRE